jgi:exopolysaccharide biosynthesis polyprenyl glycosylphosphotransferase
MVGVLMSTRLRGVRVVDLTDFYEENWSKVPVFYLQRSWFAMAQGFQLLHNPVGLKLKRVFDIFGSGLLFLLTLPILVLTMIAIKLESRGSVFFTQVRVGENGRTFTVFKLRSMRTDAESTGAAWASTRDPRVTRVGRFIRATRIDELPQLLNVLRGEMSFIGPRPERPEFMKQLEREIPFYNLRHILKPGITGWAQVMYPYGASVEDARQKLQYELFYIKNYSLLLDAAIVLKTVRVVLFGQGQ